MEVIRFSSSRTGTVARSTSTSGGRSKRSWPGHSPPARRPGPGRPKLGVVSREVSLLPRHWEWLERQPNGISAALRRLVDEARKREPDEERARLALEAAGAFMWGMAGDCPASRKRRARLFAGDHERLESLVRDWPPDIRAHLLRLTRKAGRLEGAETLPAD